MRTTYRRASRRRLDVSSLASGVFSYCLVTCADANALVMAPSIVAVTIGITHVIKREAPRG